MPNVIRYISFFDNASVPGSNNLGINALRVFDNVSDNYVIGPEGYYKHIGGVGLTGIHVEDGPNSPIILRYQPYFQAWIRMGPGNDDINNTAQFIGFSEASTGLSIPTLGPPGVDPNHNIRIGFYRNGYLGPDAWKFNINTVDNSDPGLTYSILYYNQLGEPILADPIVSDYYLVRMQFSYITTDTFDVVAQMIDSEGNIYNAVDGLETTIRFTFDEDLLLRMSCCKQSNPNGNARLFLLNHMQTETYKPS